MALKVNISPDISVLATALAERLRGDLRREEIDLFLPASIVVPHANLGRWVCLRLARELGIAANLEFPYLEGALWRALAGGAALPPKRLDAAKLQQVIYSLFVQPALRDDPAMGPAWAYIGGGAALADEWPPDAQRRAWQLADRVARLFLEYECQRPEMIAAWLDDRLSDDATLDPVMQGWQQRLYHAIFRPGEWRAQTLPQYCTLPQYRATIELSDSPADARPLYFFGLGHTSPFHLDLLCDLARGRDLHLYLCLPPTAHTGAHELLTLWGKSSQQMLTMFDTRRVACTVPDFAPTTTVPSTLATLRQTICGQPAITPQAQDRSLQVWACPGQHREVESVYQMILAQIAADPSLRLTDIAVLVTDMDSYLPTLHEVFGRNGRRIPYNLVDANASRISQYSAAVTAVLNLIGSPFTRRDVFAILSNPCYLAAVGADAEMPGNG